MQHALRPALAPDAESIAALATQVFLDTYATEGVRPDLAREALSEYGLKAFQGRLAEPSCRFILAERGTALLGFAEVLIGPTVFPVNSVSGSELVRLYVQPRAQGQSLGSSLLIAAERLTISAGQSNLWLTVWEHNTRAIGFYLSKGYELVGSTTYTFQGHTYRNQVLAKHLGQGNSAA